MRSGCADEKDGVLVRPTGRHGSAASRGRHQEARSVVRNGMVPGQDKVAARMGEMDLRGGRFG
jgi:hypothetical protein